MNAFIIIIIKDYHYPFKKQELILYNPQQNREISLDNFLLLLRYFEDFYFPFWHLKWCTTVHVW